MALSVNMKVEESRIGKELPEAYVKIERFRYDPMYDAENAEIHVKIFAAAPPAEGEIQAIGDKVIRVPVGAIIDKDALLTACYGHLKAEVYPEAKDI